MTKRILLGATALQTFAAFGLASAFATPAFAGDGAATAETSEAVEANAAAAAAQPTSESSVTAGQEVAESEAIVVTGSRIRRPNLESPLPVTSIGGQEFFETGNVSVGDTLNDLPALRSTFSQANSTRFLGTAGLNLLDLRGLGTVRTLVLQNGRRHVGGDVLASGVTPDVNTIPTDLIERVDVVTGGNSAVYGSDAISGVVNFVLKDDYEGLQLRAQGGISKYEDAGAYFVSGLWGTNFADGRGNVAINAEYAHQSQYFGAKRPFINTTSGFVVVDTDAVDDPATDALENADGVPDRIFFKDIRNAGLTNTGVLRFGGTTAANSCGQDPLGGFQPCVFMFQPDGTLVPVTGVRVGLTPGVFIGGNGENFRGGDQFQLSPDLDRYNVNILAHYEISPALVPFVEAKYSRTETSGSGSSGPAFITGSTLDGNRERIRIDNPFLSDQARAVICAERARTLDANGVPLGCVGTTRLSLRENLLGLGVRNEQAKRETYRIVTGVRGNFNDDWNYEFAVNYGKLKEETKVLGNLDVQRFLLGMDAAVNPNTGQIQCRSQFDPAAAFGIGINEPNAAARLAADIAACVPINPFGGNFSEEVRDYVLRDTVSKGETSQLNIVGFVGGDTSGFLNLPGGPINFVLGAEYRADDVYYDQDDDVSFGYTFYNAIPTFEAEKSKVKEAFAEIRIPILKDETFFEELEISGAARVSDYSIGNTGTVWAYNASAIWSPVKGLRFRGNYGRSVRAPNQIELFSLPGQNFAPGFADPCSSLNIATGSSNRAANCAADGRPGGTNAATNPSRAGTPAPNPAGPYDFRYDQSLELISGGNTELEAETSDSYTLGFVATPAFLPGVSLSVDWYKINVNNVITVSSAQAIVNACYDLPDLNNQFCALFDRVPTGQTGPNGEQEFRIIEGSLFQQPLNFAKLVAKGIDLELAYRGNFFDAAKIDTRLTYTHVLDRSNNLDPTNPEFKNVIVGKHGGELGDPEDSFNWNVNLTRGKVTFGYQMRFLSRMYVNTYEDQNSVQGRPPENLDFADRVKFPARYYHDVRLAIDVTKKLNLYMGVDNATNEHPPLGQTGIGAGSAIYDARGRFFYAGVNAKF
jgi:outer membrane receptor protein involved in Fe transport